LLGGRRAVRCGALLVSLSCASWLGEVGGDARCGFCLKDSVSGLLLLWALFHNLQILACNVRSRGPVAPTRPRHFVGDAVAGVVLSSMVRDGCRRRNCLGLCQMSGWLYFRCRVGYMSDVGWLMSDVELAICQMSDCSCLISVRMSYVLFSPSRGSFVVPQRLPTGARKEKWSGRYRAEYNMQ
jgi:hypothetical protein